MDAHNTHSHRKIMDTIFLCITQWVNLCMHCKMITTINLVTTCHHTKLIKYYQLYSPYYIPMIYFMTGSLYPLFSFDQLIPPRPVPLHSLMCSLYLQVWVLTCLVLSSRFYVLLRSYGIFLSLSDLFHSASYPQVSTMSQMAKFHCLGLS